VKKIYLILSVSFLFHTLCIGQSRLDSMRQLVHDAPTDERRIDYLNQLADELFDHSLDESLQVVGEALQLSRKINYKHGQGWALINLGIYHWLAGNPKEALQVQQQAGQIGYAIHDAGIIAYVKLQNGKVYRDIGLYDSAMANFKQAEIYQKAHEKNDPYALSMIYTALGKQYNLMDMPEQGIVYIQRALHIREEMKRPQLLAYSWIDLGSAYRHLYDRSKAKACFDKGLSFSPHDIWVQAEYADGMAMLAFTEGEFAEALQNFAIVLRTYEEYKGKHTLAQTMLRMAEILEDQGLFDLAHEYVNRALKLADECGYQLLMAEAHYELAWIAMRTGRLSEARASIAQAEKMFVGLGNRLRVGGCYNVKGLVLMKAQRYDSALSMHQQGLAIRQEFANQAAISSSLFNIGDLYLEWGNFPEALRYLKQGYAIDETLGDKYGLSLYQSRLARAYLNMSEYQQADAYLNKALVLAQQVEAVDLMRSIYSDYAVLAERQGNLSHALSYRRLYEQVNDSLYNRGSAQSLAAYRALYELDVKNREIELLNKDKQLQQEKIQQRNLVLIIAIVVVVLLLVIAVILFFTQKRVKRFNREISERNEEIQTQSEELQESNNALISFNEEITSQREEIAHQAEELRVSHETITRINEGLEKMIEMRTRELRAAYQELDTFFYRSSHDFRRPLTTLMGLAEVAKLSVSDNNALDLFQKVNATAINLDKMLQKLQSISDVGSLQLVVKEVPLRGMVDELISNNRDAIQKRGIQMTTALTLTKAFVSYPVLVKIIIENLLENAVVFSVMEQGKITIKAYHQIHDVVIEIEDTGEGIKPDIQHNIFEMFFRGSERSTGNGLGLYITKKAVDKLNGKISFDSEPNVGTRFKVVIPNLFN
jgi:signal transduction histidine kinase